MTGSVFINYRRDDEPNFAMLLYTRLERKFPSDRLFMDIDGIALGDDFVGVLRDRVAKCDVVLSIIGTNWLEARDGNGKRRLDDPNDFVRIEIEQALALGKRVIPVLVGQTAMPRPEDLPDTLRPIVTRNAVRFTPDRFRIDAETLERALDRLLASTATGEPDPQAAGSSDTVAASEPAFAVARLGLASWQRAAALAALATVLYLLTAALKLLLADSPIQFAINATFAYRYNPSYDFGLSLTVAFGLYLFAGLSAERSAIAYLALQAMSFAIDLGIHLAAAQFFTTVEEFYAGGSMGPFVWFVYAAAFAVPYMLAVSLFCPMVRAPLVIAITSLPAAGVYYYFAVGGLPSFGSDSVVPNFGFVVSQIVTAAGCGWAMRPSTAATP